MFIDELRKLFDFMYMHSEVLCSLTLVGITVLWITLRKMLAPYGGVMKSIIVPNVAGSLLTSRFIKAILFYIIKFRRLISGHSGLNCFIAADCAHSYILLQILRCYINKHNSITVPISLYIVPLQTISSSTSYFKHMKWYILESSVFGALYSDYGLKTIDNQEIMSYFECGCNGADSNSVEGQDWYKCMVVINMKLVKLQSKYLRNESAISCLDELIELVENIWREDRYRQCKSVLLAEYNDIENVFTTETTSALQRNKELLVKLFHYGSGMTEFCGTWYTPNRFHHLERVLIPCRATLFNRDEDSYMGVDAKTRLLNCTRFNVPSSLVCHASPLDPPEPDVIELFYSFRSPYSQLVLDRILYLCAKYKKKLLVRPVLPMVIRKLSVPVPKAAYIALDATREAERWNFPFGKICDPRKLHF